jgi:PAS domain S-box-containing protein
MRKTCRPGRAGDPGPITIVAVPGFADASLFQHGAAGAHEETAVKDRIDLEGRCGACLLFGAIEGLEDGVVLVDPRGRVFHVNRAAERILGVRAERMNGTAVGPWLRPAGLAAFWTTAGRSGDPAGTELVLPGGRSIRVTASVCRSASGDPIGRALMLRDVTRERKVQVEISAAVARRLVDLAGGEVAGVVAPSLTAREREILGLLAGGLTNAQIAARLHVSANTVASHLKHLFPKIRASNRSQAAAYAVGHGFRPDGIPGPGSGGARGA